jgi:hypothetical protein
MTKIEYALADTVEMKKAHACQTNNWEILRLGADIRLKCMGCGHIIMMSRGDFNRKLKKVLTKAQDPVNHKLKFYLAKDQIHQPNLK